MEKLNLPEYEFRIRTVNNKTEIFDKVRKKYIRLTPEEWVRQNFIQYLNQELGYPISLISVELSKTVYKRHKRVDIIFYNNQGSPLVLVECKAPSVKLSQDVFDQALRYNIVLKVPFVIITNGLQHYCCKMNYEDLSYSFLKEIPGFETLN
jgi:hypothetical protein